MWNGRAITKGLKYHKCKKGKLKCPPIPYVPEMNEVQEMVQKSCKQFYNIKLEDKTGFSIAIWDAGTDQQFLNNIMNALNAWDH